MKNLESSFRALRVLHTAKDLFTQDGFNTVGVDRIIAEAKIPKATFYNIFHSKARLIEMCLTFQTDALKVKVLSIINSYRELMVFDKLKQIYFLHANSNGLYYLLFKAIFEIKTLYPMAYRIAIEYRTWLVNEIYKLLLTVKTEASVDDARMFLFVVDGGMIQLLSKNQTGEQDKLVEYFLLMMS
ncbi:TetR/AcrR family transcriptional regulator [Acinetobacter pittii]|uniref:TetR/AcrR family transcriptional regulator n=1 Tax=Acinetobacter pittii TaxID=48296 RepID=A0A6H0FVJ5_ACIPI|nr:TetR/AcrR family transcriptional regulator [Acinetobacter pittii]QIT18427.1 TetR/AcrR family transcriptional regulator [Acinetobacter pittii]